MTKATTFVLLTVVAVLSGCTSAQDFGCIREFRTIVTKYQFIAIGESIHPYCVVGGLYRHVQCRRLYPYGTLRCYCAFIDTGAENTAVAVDMYRQTLTEMLAVCPADTEYKGDVCKTPPITYPCQPSMKKFRYVAETGKCVEQVGGCRGFATEQQCMDSCAPIVYDQCSFRTNMGYPCSQPAGTRYRHNAVTGQCETFNYRGCGGNSNNYKHLWECEKSCVPQNEVSVLVEVELTKVYNVTALEWVLQKYSLYTDEPNLATQSTFDDIEEDAISTELISDSSEDIGSDSRAFVIGGVFGSLGNPSQGEPNRENMSPSQVCHQAPYTGPCRAYNPRWFFNDTSLKCESFIWGGCLSRENNFGNKISCREFCHPDYPNNAIERAGSSQDSSDSYLEDGTEVVWRFPGSSSSNSGVQPRTVLLSDGPSGDGSSGHGANPAQTT